MSTFRMDDGTVIKTENAVQSWEEVSDWDGRNHISRATGDQWVHEKLHQTRKGRYWVEHWSQWQGSHSHAEFVSPQEATRWLLNNEHLLPKDLEKYRDEIEE